ncbi:MAG: MerR family DNA-binding protein [Acidimicrobiales bacterium]
MPLTVSQLAERARISSDAVRYYGRLGLLPETGRTGGGHRYYDEAALERLRFIKGAQWLDLTLDEIRELLELWDSGACPCGPASAVLRQRIAAIDDQASRLQQMRRVLCAMLDGDPVAAAGTGAEGASTAGSTVAALVGRDLSDDAQAGCGCCRAPAAPTREEEVQELQARMAAVQRRLRNVGSEVATHAQKGVDR